MKKESRAGWGGVEFRAEEAEGRMVIRGHAAVFEKFSQDLGRFREKIAKGAFVDSIAKRDVRALWSHNIDLVLGRTGNKSLRLWEDDFGLAFELEMPNTTLGKDSFVSVQRGDVSAMSFGFSVLEEEWKRGEDGAPHERTLKKIELFEISPVAFPAYEQTEVSVRDMDGIIKELESKWEMETNGLWKKQEEVEAWRPKI